MDRRVVAALLFLLVGGLLAQRSHAQSGGVACTPPLTIPSGYTPQYEYFRNWPPSHTYVGPFTTAALACADMVSHWNANGAPGSEFLTLDSAEENRCELTHHHSGGTSPTEHALVRNCFPTTAPTECDADFPGVGDSHTTNSNPGSGNTYCHALSGCKVEVSQTTSMGSGATVYTWTHTDDPCDEGDEAAGGDEEPGESCATSGSDEFCAQPNEENCGYFNDDFVCFNSIEEDGCSVFSDGGRVCGSDAPMPPVPDNGTPGQPATPDQVVNVTTGSTTNTFNYYNSSTVGGSSRDPGTSGDNPYDGDDDGSGEDDGDGGGEGDGGNGTDDDGCAEEDGCTGTLPAIGDTECESFGACATAFYARVQGAPLIESVANVGDSFPSGSCPAVNITMFGETSSLSEPMCDMWADTVAPIISVIMLVLFAWVATRVVLSA